MNSTVRKILLISLTNIGDVILTVPVFAALRANFPEARIAVLTGAPGFGIFERSRFVNEVILYDKKAAWWEKLLLVKRLMRARYDLVVDLRNTLIPLFLRPPYKTSFIRPLRKKIISKSEEHIAALRPLEKLLGIDPSRRIPFDFYDSKDAESLRKTLSALEIWNHDSLVLIAAGAKSEIKRWTLHGFSEVADRLVRELGKTVVLIGDTHDRELADEIGRLSSQKLFNLCGETNLRQLAALMAISELVVTNDSAPMHLAYALGVSVVAIFGPTDERKYGRENSIQRIVRQKLPCSPCEKAHCQIEETKACLNQISSQQVYEVCQDLFRRAGNLV